MYCIISVLCRENKRVLKTQICVTRPQCVNIFKNQSWEFSTLAIYNTIILFKVGEEIYKVSSRAILASLRSILSDSSSLQIGVPHAMPNLTASLSKRSIIIKLLWG